MIPLFLVVPDRRLSWAIRVVDEQNRFETVRFRSLQHALEKRNPAELLLVQWTTEEIIAELSRQNPFEPLHRLSPLIVYCPELPQKTVAEGEAIRFALLQLGVTAVFSQLRELPSILSMIQRHFNRVPPPKKEWTQTIFDSLPWKK